MTIPLKSAQNIYGLSTYRHIDKPTIRHNKPLDILGFSGPWNPPKNVRSPSHRSLCPTTPRRWCLGISLPRGRVATPPTLAHPGARCRWLWCRPDHGLLPALTVETVFRFVDGEEELKWRARLLVTYFRQYQYFFLHYFTQTSTGLTSEHQQPHDWSCILHTFTRLLLLDMVRPESLPMKWASPLHIGLSKGCITIHLYVYIYHKKHLVPNPSMYSVHIYQYMQAPLV